MICQSKWHNTFYTRGDEAPVACLLLQIMYPRLKSFDSFKKNNMILDYNWLLPSNGTVLSLLQYIKYIKYMIKMQVCAGFFPNQVANYIEPCFRDEGDLLICQTKNENKRILVGISCFTPGTCSSSKVSPVILTYIYGILQFLRLNGVPLWVQIHVHLLNIILFLSKSIY